MENLYETAFLASRKKKIKHRGETPVDANFKHWEAPLGNTVINSILKIGDWIAEREPKGDQWSLSVRRGDLIHAALWKIPRV